MISQDNSWSVEWNFVLDLDARDEGRIPVPDGVKQRRGLARATWIAVAARDVQGEQGRLLRLQGAVGAEAACRLIPPELGHRSTRRGGLLPPRLRLRGIPRLARCICE